MTNPTAPEIVRAAAQYVADDDAAFTAAFAHYQDTVVPHGTDAGTARSYLRQAVRNNDRRYTVPAAQFVADSDTVFTAAYNHYRSSGMIPAGTSQGTAREYLRGALRDSGARTQDTPRSQPAPSPVTPQVSTPAPSDTLNVTVTFTFPRELLEYFGV